MKALKIAGAAVAAILVVAALLVVIGIPSGFLTSAIQDRVERQTGYRLAVAGSTRIGLWPSFNVTLNDVTLEGPGDREASLRLTAGSIKADMTLASLWSGRPAITELAIVRPVLTVPLLRARSAALKSSPPARASSSNAADSGAPTIEHVTVTDGTVMFSSLRDRFERRTEDINASAIIGADRRIRVTGSARAGEHPLTFDIRAAIPAPPIERQNVPVELTLEAPGVLQAKLSAKAEVRLNGPVVMINGLAGAIGDGAFNGWASVDTASKPLVKLDLDFQRLDIDARPAPAASQDSSSISQSPSPVFLALLEQRHLRPHRIELCRRRGPAFRRRTQHRASAFCAGRDQLHARRRRSHMRGFQPRRLWRPGQRRNRHRRLRRHALLSDARRSHRRARLAAAAEHRRLRQARRQAAGEDRRALHRHQPARDHVQPRRHGGREFPGRRHPRPQRRADDPLADIQPAVGMAGGQGSGDRSDSTVRLVRHRRRARPPRAISTWSGRWCG